MEGFNPALLGLGNMGNMNMNDMNMMELMAMGDLMPGMAGMPGMMGGLPGMMGVPGLGVPGAGMAAPMAGATGMLRPTPPPPPGPPPATAPPPLTAADLKKVYHKTRICAKWLHGQCPYSDASCHYAHGEAQLRHVPPELIKQAELLKAREEQAKQQQAQQQQGATPGGPQAPAGAGGPGGERQQLQAPSAGQPGQQQRPPGAGQATGSSSGVDLTKTKLCHEFMRQGSCRNGAACRFAHGPQELREPGGPAGGGAGRQQQAQQAQQQQQMGGRQQPGMQGGMGVTPPPGGPMGFKPPPPPGAPPGSGMGAPGAAGSMMQPRPPPPAGPPPPGSAGMDHRAQQPGSGRAQQSPGDRAGGMQAAPGREPSWEEEQRMEAEAPGPRLTPPAEVPLLERVRAMCVLVGVGEGDLKPDPSAVQAAVVAARSGSAFHESAYADSIESFVRQQAPVF
ncbi:hypothetical protein N2152v2_009072 [Parachlorella kessleri]